MPISRKPRLVWHGKDESASIPKVCLQEDVALGRRVQATSADNRLIHGDNLAVLSALQAEYRGRFRCIYLDPPYNTRRSRVDFDDGLLHAHWLAALRLRLQAQRELLRDDGSLWMQLDDHEAHYAKVLADEVLGRRNFVASITWKRRASQANLGRHLAPVHDHILVYAKDLKLLRLEKIPLRPSYVAEKYRNPDCDPRGQWRRKPLLVGPKSRNPVWTVQAPDGRRLTGRWRVSPATYAALLADGRIHWGDGEQPVIKLFLSENQGQLPSTFWDGPGTNEEAARESEALFGQKGAFDTPKPEALLARIIAIATQPGDWVLDAYAGSGTTGAVAHKMARQWVMIEQGEQCLTRIVPRMRRVIDGDDPGGATAAAGWLGGGAYGFWRAAPADAPP